MPSQAVPNVQARLHKYVTDFKPQVSYGWVMMLRFRQQVAAIRSKSAA